MFAVQLQTVQAIIPGDDRGAALIFRNDADDVAKSILELVNPDGDRIVLTFNTRGSLCEQQFIQAEHDESAAEIEPIDEPFTGEIAPTNTDEGETNVEETQGEDGDHQAGAPSEKQPA